MMKLTLDLDSLVVESFDTAPGLAGRGTVRGHDSEPPSEGMDTCEGCDPTYQSGCIIQSCGASCPLSCGQTCPFSCDAGCPSGASVCHDVTCDPERC